MRARSIPCLLLLVAASLLAASAADYTALDRYVAAPDASYRYQLVRTLPAAGATIFQLQMTSQNWLTTAEVDRPEWRHWLTIIKPDQLATSTVLLNIDGGSNSDTPDTPDALFTLLAVQAGAVIVDLAQVPSQPLQFADETRTRSEDAIIAYSWDKYLRTGDEKWPARLPMTKAAVRAMDAASDFLSSAAGGGMAVRNFIVMGGSKRGWTTWSTAAVDPRVVAIAPIVFDALNFEAVMVHQYRAYGYWEPTLQDYVDAGVMNWFNTPQMANLLDIEDPYLYRDRLALPKYLVNAAGDQFFLPDCAQFYFADLPGEKYLRYIPNTDHGMSGAGTLEAASNILAWFQAVTQNFPRPRFYWRMDRGQGTLLLRVVDQPAKVLLWQATNPNARDFRLETIGPAWSSTPVDGQNGVYTVTVPQPAQGFTAYFLELTYPGPADLPLVFTTEVGVTPDVYPFDAPPMAAAAAASAASRAPLAARAARKH